MLMLLKLVNLFGVRSISGKDKPEILSISSSYPVYDEEQNLQGVIGVDLILSQINDFLSSIDLESFRMHLYFRA